MTGVEGNDHMEEVALSQNWRLRHPRVKAIEIALSPDSRLRQHKMTAFRFFPRIHLAGVTLSSGSSSII